MEEWTEKIREIIYNTEQFQVLKKRMESVLGNYDEETLNEFCFAIISEASELEKVVKSSNHVLKKIYEDFVKEYEKEKGSLSPEYIWELLKELGDEYYQDANL